MTKNIFLILITSFIPFIAFAESQKTNIEFKTMTNAEARQEHFKWPSMNDETEDYVTVIHVNDIDPQTRYSLSMRRKVVSPGTIRLISNELGEALLKSLPTDSKGNPCILIGATGYYPGEEIDIILKSSNGGDKNQKISFIPNPYRINDSITGLTGEVMLLNLYETSYGIVLKGFKINEPITIISESEGEKLEGKPVIAKEEQMLFGSQPKVKGKDRGVCYFTVKREDGRKLTIQLPWGETLFSMSHEQESF